MVCSDKRAGTRGTVWQTVEAKRQATRGSPGSHCATSCTRLEMSWRLLSAQPSRAGGPQGFLDQPYKVTSLTLLCA